MPAQRAQQCARVEGSVLAVPEVYNVFDGELKEDPDEPEGYCRRWGRFGDSIGAKELGGTVYELAPGEKICAYHYEYGNEEWLLGLEGEPMLRTPDGERPLKPGDVVVFLEGPSGAHNVINRTDETARVVIFSTKREPAVAVYPDSDKIGVWTPNDEDDLMAFRSSQVEYLEGEPRD